jgi:hypothetical protein
MRGLKEEPMTGLLMGEDFGFVIVDIMARA